MCPIYYWGWGLMTGQGHTVQAQGAGSINKVMKTYETRIEGETGMIMNVQGD